MAKVPAICYLRRVFPTYMSWCSTAIRADGPVPHLLCDDVAAHRIVHHVVLVVQVLNAAQRDARQGPQVLLALQVRAGLQQCCKAYRCLEKCCSADS